MSVCSSDDEIVGKVQWVTLCWSLFIRIIQCTPLSTRHLESNFSFSIHILFDNWVRNSRLFGSLRASEGTNPLFESTFSSSSIIKTEFILWVLLDFSWLMVIAEKCCLKPLKAAVCFPNFCLKTLKDSVWFPDLLVTAIIPLLLLLLLRQLLASSRSR